MNLQEQLNMADTYFKNLDDDSKKKYVSQVLERCKQVWGVDELYEIEDESGHTVITGHSTDSDVVDITRLKPGTYRVSLIYKQIKQYTTFVKN